MSLLKLFADEFLGLLHQSNDQRTLKKFILNGPETLVGYFLDESKKNVLPDAVGYSLKGKRKTSLEFRNGLLRLILSDVKITTGYDEESNRSFKLIQCIGFFEPKLGMCISVANEEELEGIKQRSFLYKTRPFNYAYLSIINSSDDKNHTFINPSSDNIFISLHLNDDYLRSIVDQLYKNLYCELTLDFNYFIDDRRKHYYIKDFSQRNNGDVRFIFDPARPSLSFSMVQVDALLAEYI
jgi:hypothetical protein